ncbi:MAG: hypothetical protein JWQ04_2789 [Pedosphaera sp.]|nr:hypothetical protein [Pedosphaera sp.]
MGVEAYNDGGVPYGSFSITTWMRKTVALTGAYILENFNVKRPTKVVERPDQIGGPNGFALVNAQETATGVSQVATSNTNRLQRGDFFTLTVDANIGAEKWVIQDLDDPYEMNGYYKQNLTLRKAYLS